MKSLTPAQQKAYDALSLHEPRCSYNLQVSLVILWALVKKGYAKDVTPFGAGGMFSPTTHYKFVKVAR